MQDADRNLKNKTDQMTTSRGLSAGGRLSIILHIQKLFKFATLQSVGELTTLLTDMNWSTGRYKVLHVVLDGHVASLE